MKNKISEHFTKEEFSCKCGCGQCIVEPELVDKLEMIRTVIGKPVIVHCVNRCPEHNADIGGVKNSEHTKGRACDFHIRGMKIPELHEIILKMREDNTINDVGLYDWGVHIGIRPGGHFWDERI